MNAEGIHVKSWHENGVDYRGKDQPRIYRIVMNGQERDVSKADLIRAIEMNLPLTKEEPTLSANGR